MEVAKASDPSVRLEAIQLAGEIEDIEERRNKTNGYRNQINYAYWDTLALAETGGANGKGSSSDLRG